MNKKEAFETWKERIGIGDKELQSTFERIGTKVKAAIEAHGMKISAGRLEQEILSAMKAELGSKFGSLKSPAPTHNGYILGDTSLVDFFELMSIKAKNAYGRNPEKAIQDGLVDRYGVPIMTYDESFGAKPLKKGDAIEGHSFQREFYVIRYIGAKKRTKFGRVTYRGSFAESLKMDTPQHARHPCDFRANVTEEGTIDRLTASKAAGTRFKHTGEEEIPFEEVEKDIKNSVGFTDILDIESEYRRVPEKQRNKMVIVIKARVIKVIEPDEARDYGNMIVHVTDDSLDFDLQEMPLTVYVPKTWYTGFDANTKLIIVGRPRTRMFMDEEQIVMEAYGVHVDPLSVIVLDDEEEAAEEEGWIGYQ